MYPGKYAASRAAQPAVIMAGSGETISYGELEARSNRLAHLLRDRGVGRLDHYSIYMENNARYVECCAAGERSGHYYTCVNSFLTFEELAYILNNSQSKVLITSQAKREVALAALPLCPGIELCLIVDGKGDGKKVLNLDEATAGFPVTPIPDESLGTAMLYSSGTTGRPKGIKPTLPDRQVDEPGDMMVAVFGQVYRFDADTVYYSPAPVYHAAPLRFGGIVQSLGGTLVMARKFDATASLAAIDKYGVTHSQWVPTMFVRMLKLPDEVRESYDVSSLTVAITPPRRARWTSRTR